jgi:hypothetical protein
LVKSWLEGACFAVSPFTDRTIPTPVELALPTTYWYDFIVAGNDAHLEKGQTKLPLEPQACCLSRSALIAFFGAPSAPYE